MVPGCGVCTETLREIAADVGNQLTISENRTRALNQFDGLKSSFVELNALVSGNLVSQSTSTELWMVF